MTRKLFSNTHFDHGDLVAEAQKYLEELFPICRSISGDGVRHTLSILKQIVEFDIIEIPSGTKCYDWVVPDEWNIEEAYIEDSAGNRIVDFKNNNLHVVSYSTPISDIVPYSELAKHLHTLPEMPDAIPYRTTYYTEDWGFCLPHRQFENLDKNSAYKVVIESTLTPGSITLGECVINGTSGKEFLVSTYCCHPSLANDNLSGQVLWTLLLRELKKMDLKHSYRFVILPETIGAISYISEHEDEIKELSGGFIVTSVAGPGKFGYKKSFRGDSEIDRVVYATFRELGLEYIGYPFDINGSDERQYSSPAFRIPVGTVCKDKYYEYDYYHTSLDDLSFISPDALVQTLKLYLLTIEKLEINLIYKSLFKHCEPQLGKRGLCPSIGGQINQKSLDFNTDHRQRDYALSDDHYVTQGLDYDAIYWLLFFCDEKTTLLDISEKTDISMYKLYEAAEKLRKHQILKV